LDEADLSETESRTAILKRVDLRPHCNYSFGHGGERRSHVHSSAARHRESSLLHLSGRALTSLESALISLGGLIGAGLFVGTGTAILAGGPPIVVSYALAGLMLLVILHLIARMRRDMPAALFITDFVPAQLGNIAGNAVRRIYGAFWTLMVTIEALAGANILAPKGGLPGLFAALGLLTATVAMGDRLSASLGEWEASFAGFKVTVLVAFIVSSVYYVGSADRSIPPLWPLPCPRVRTAASVLAALATALFSLAGAEIIHSVANSPSCAGRAAARAIGLMSIRVFGIYLASIVLILCIVPWNANKPGFSPFTLALERLHYPLAAHLMSVVILIAVLTTLNSAFAMSSRLLRPVVSDAPAGVLPGKDASPILSRLITSAIAVSVLCTAAHWPAGAYRYLVTSASVLLVTVFIFFVLAADRYESRARAQLARPGTDANGWIRRALIAALAGVLFCMAWMRESRSSLCSALSLVALIVLLEVTTRLRVARGN
jgi:GABA permease